MKRSRVAMSSLWAPSLFSRPCLQVRWCDACASRIPIFGKDNVNKRAEIRARSPEQLDLQPECYSQLSVSALSTLDKTVNEVWLFHGTSEEAAKSISTGLFRLPSSGGRFGKGVYFADRASKSHGYSSANKDTLQATRRQVYSTWLKII